jgi:iron complex transport system ATP-binding protein
MTTLLRAQNLSFSYVDRPALRGVDLTLANSEIVALLGPNGSGKSTLIQSLLGHLNASGQIDWFGKSLVQWNHRELAKKLAYLPQSPGYEPGQRVVDVLRLGRSPYWSAFGIESTRDEQVVVSVSDQLGLTELLTRPMAELSGGQRQRVFVGRCLVQEPAALLLDEPNTFLDLKHQVELCKLLRELANSKSIGVVMALHDLNLAAAFADRVVLLNHGVVAAAGRVDVLEPELLGRVYGLPMVELSRPDGVAVYVPA